MNSEEVKRIITEKIYDIPDFPTEGVLFKDITPLLADRDTLKLTIEWMAGHLTDVDYVISPEARGFIFGTAVAYSAGKGFVPLRKPGKLPREVYRETYGLEYGTDELQMHIDALPAGARVAFVDDVMATGGTLKACQKLVASAGATLVRSIFLLEIDFLEGRNGLDIGVHSLINC